MQLVLIYFCHRIYGQNILISPINEIFLEVYWRTFKHQARNKKKSLKKEWKDNCYNEIFYVGIIAYCVVNKDTKTPGVIEILDKIEQI